ncbi:MULTISPECIES: PDDEXK nuclease domain-containing protein [Nostocales]|uniref:DUF1016 domain-containing protein n=5 Tax=Nostocales TaxID=1161 RepID=A0A8S9TAF7_9CYAN|nr:PDDEXK nuclease domain-containing protein [Tolypothrix bouteillei]KAF3888612.1 DUF1016 domain-containing protein [Tolypothrix bouteillei VB521301]
MAPRNKSNLQLPANYGEALKSIKARIHSTQIQAAVAVNKELIALYWDIGQEIISRQESEGWGTAVIERLAKDLQKSFPGVKGFSARNIWRIRAFYLAYTLDVKSVVDVIPGVDGIILPQAVAEIPWGHNILLLEKVKDLKARFWYVHKTLEHGWSRSVLWHHIDTKLYERQFEAEKTTNFNFTLPSPQSDLARELLKDPYNFDFLTLAKDAQERDLERGLLEHIREFLLELGVGFAFMGSQYHLKVGDEDFYIDLLFYHVKLRCYVVIDLKMKEFKPEFSGKMSFYVSAVDDILRHPDDQPTIGIILCKSKDKTVVEYSLQNMNRPIGVSTYKLRDVLPEKLQGSLPTIEQLEAELDAVPLEIEDEE